MWDKNVAITYDCATIVEPSTLKTIGRMLVQTLFWLAVVMASPCQGQGQNDYRLAAGDSIHILVFQNPDLTLDTRVSESGTISYPLIGVVRIGGLTIAQAEQRIVQMLEAGNFLKQAQVNISLLQIVGNMVSVLGQVGRPGSYPLLTFNTRVSQMLATAGGIALGGSDLVIVTGTRNGHPFRREIDIVSSYLNNSPEDDILLEGGDTLFVSRAPLFYIYGEVQHPGSYPLLRNMTVVQALATGGGLTVRGTERSLRVYRRDKNGVMQPLNLKLLDAVRADDVIDVGESLF